MLAITANYVLCICKQFVVIGCLSSHLFQQFIYSIAAFSTPVPSNINRKLNTRSIFIGVDAMTFLNNGNPCNMIL